MLLLNTYRCDQLKFTSNTTYGVALMLPNDQCVGYFSFSSFFVRYTVRCVERFWSWWCPFSLIQNLVYVSGQLLIDYVVCVVPRKLIRAVRLVANRSKIQFCASIHRVCENRTELKDEDRRHQIGRNRFVDSEANRRPFLFKQELRI